MFEQIHQQQRHLFEKPGIKRWQCFSFADDYRPDAMGFHALRTLNESVFLPGAILDEQKLGTAISYWLVLHGQLDIAFDDGDWLTLHRGQVLHFNNYQKIAHYRIRNASITTGRLLELRFMLCESDDAVAPTINQLQRESGRTSVTQGDENSPCRRIYLHDVEAQNTLSLNLLERPALVYVTNGMFAANSHMLDRGDRVQLLDQATLNIKAMEAGQVLLVLQ